MSADEEQNRRIDKNEDAIEDLGKRMNTVETNLALSTQEVANLSTTFTTGMTDLKDVLKARDDEARKDRRQERADALTEASAKREQSRWFWGKVFGIVASLVTLAGGGGAYYYAQQPGDAVHAPAPAPAAIEDGGH